MSLYKLVCVLVLALVWSTIVAAQTCTSGADCPDLHHCDNPSRAVHVDRACIDGECRSVDGSSEDCLDIYYCLGDEIMYAHGYCSDGFCVEDSPTVHAVCSDYWTCSGNTAELQERYCMEGSTYCHYKEGMPRMKECDLYGKVCQDGDCVYLTTSTTTTIPDIPLPEYPTPYIPIVATLLAISAMFFVTQKR